MGGRGNRQKFGDALQDAEHADFGIAERDEAGIEPLSARSRHGFAVPPDVAAQGLAQGRGLSQTKGRRSTAPPGGRLKAASRQAGGLPL